MRLINLFMKQKQVHRLVVARDGVGEGWIGSLGLVDANDHI